MPKSFPPLNSREGYDALSKILKDNLGDHLAEFGLSLDVKGGQFNREGTNVTLKVEVSTVTKDGTVLTKAAEDFKSMAFMYGLEPEDLGRTFKFKDQHVQIIGLLPKRRKFPIEGKNMDTGKVMLYPIDIVKRGLSKKAVAVPAEAH